jgi:hypothetical protein
MGGSDICMDQLGGVCGGRMMAVRAVCADAGEDMPERWEETRCASAPRLGYLRGALESRRRIRKCGPLTIAMMACLGESGRRESAGSC